MAELSCESSSSAFPFVADTPTPESPMMVEMAYLLLDECYNGFCVDGNFDNGPSSSSPLPPLNQWLPVLSTPKQRWRDTVSPPLDGTNRGLCRCCRLVMQQNAGGLENSNKEYELQLNWDHVPAFDGTVRDVAALNSTKSMPHCDLDCCCTDQLVGRANRRRSDAALLAGLLVACQDHVQVVQCSVMFCHQDGNTFYGSLLVTLAFPHLSLASDGQSKRTILPRSRNKRSHVGAIKPLKPALQLLLALVRSDWDQLESMKCNLLRCNTPDTWSAKKHISFFPTKLTLRDVYNRMKGSTGQVRPNFLMPSGDDSCGLTTVPLDLLQEKIAPYLSSRSLASVRSTCMYLHWSLRSIVPGLKLRLFAHQVNSLYWMRRREASLMKTESDCDNALESSYGEDVRRAITGGASVRLSSNPSASNRAIYLYIDPWTGLEILREELLGNEKLPRRVACGGLLCDDPGLGKTITVLALILQTYQHTTNRKMTPSVVRRKLMHAKDDNISTGASVEDIQDDILFQTYWEEQVVVDFRRPALLKLVNDYCRRIAKIGNFPLNSIQKSIANDNSCVGLKIFQEKIESAIVQSNEKLAQCDVSSLLDIFRTFFHDFKVMQMRSVRKSFSNAKSKPNSRVAALVEEEGRQRLLDSLIPSTGTLIVIPSVLLEHWKTQIKLYIDFRYCTEKLPLIFEYQRNDSEMTVDEATILCLFHETHTPLIFIDNAGTRPLPPAEFLSTFQIVITTTHRFMNEAKKGSFQDELESHYDTNVLSFFYDDEYERHMSKESCELLKVHWLRMVVDEGHSMGNDKNNSTIQFSAWVKSRRRWAMTGTPTKHNSSQLGQMGGLLRFLQHEFFTSRLGGDLVWKKYIVKCWRDGDMASFFRLRSLLCFLMRRHTKFNIFDLLPPSFSKSRIKMSHLEVNTYNTLVSAVQMNLLLTSMVGKTSGFQDSLLHRSQSKNARLALQNIRRVCTGWSRVVPTISNRFYIEALDMARSFNLSENVINEMKLFMSRAEQEELSTCSCCGIRVSTLLLMSCCGGQICTECMDSSTSICYLCDNAFDVDELQKFQPGFVLEWRSNLDLVKSSIKVPGSVPGLSPEGDPLIRPTLERRRTRKLGDGHVCEYDPYAADGRCVKCLEEHNFCCLLNSCSRCEVCHRASEECPEDESKSFFLSRRLLELVEQMPNLQFSTTNESSSRLNSRPLKVIVFSQFRAALNFVGDRLLRKFGTACVAEYFGSHRKQELQKFTSERCCFCLLLTKDGSEGLDLSFVTNIIFLEEVFDKSLEDQVVARAWRMGAKGSVIVETLIANNSVEETMSEHVQGPYDDDDVTRSSNDQHRLKSLLESLRFNTDHHHFSRPVAATSGEDDSRNDSYDGTLKRRLALPLTEGVIQSPKRLRQSVRFAE